MLRRVTPCAPWSAPAREPAPQPGWPAGRPPLPAVLLPLLVQLRAGGGGAVHAYSESWSGAAAGVLMRPVRAHRGVGQRGRAAAQRAAPGLIWPS